MMRESVPLAPFTTLGVGGEARFFCEAKTESDVQEARAFAEKRSLPLFAIGNGSNLLVPDKGIEGIVAKISLDDVHVEEKNDRVTIRAGAGASWDRIVREAENRAVFGLENLAGIPGTLGGAAVQNVGAYGREFSRSFAHARSIDTKTGETVTIGPQDASFSYRMSLFKSHPEFLITEVALELSRTEGPDLSYADLTRARDAGVPLSSPAEIGKAVREIRSRKFPEEGSAGSFFKNPLLAPEKAEALKKRFPELPTFPQGNGTEKIALAWLLDHALSLKGYAKGPVRLYERQPLVLVASRGARAADVEALAREIEERMYREFSIAIEREVETFGARA